MTTGNTVLNHASLRNDPDTLAIEHAAAFFFLARWVHPRDGRFARLWRAAIGARADVANMLDRLDTIRLDARLSDAAKGDDEKEAARKTLVDLGGRQRILNDEGSRLDADRLKLADVSAADAPQAVVDVALAQHFRTLAAAEREVMLGALVAGSEPRMVDAILRLPAVLFGLTPEMRSAIESNALARRAPEAVRELQQLGEATRTTQSVLTRCVALVIERSALTLEERMVSLGAGAWQRHVKDGAPNALAALARRYGVEEAA